MNLTEALNVALPDIPTRVARERPPRKHPKLIFRQHGEGEKAVIRANITGQGDIYQFSPVEWALIQLFDGTRSWEEIAQEFSAHQGVEYTVDEVREFASNLEGFWYKTPAEENIGLTQKLREHRQRHQKKKAKSGDVSYMHFSAWNPDAYFDRIQPYLEFAYTWWFTTLTVAAFALMGYIFVQRWDEIGRDTLQFYNFAEKGLYDIAEFWVLTCVVLFIHESAHGLSCKHYGGRVHNMGFHLIYLTPAFFTDVTEAWVYATRPQRLVTIISGAWSEMIICAIATPIWWGTPQGSAAHEVAYKLILITGLGVIFINWNPLIKLDGYYLLTELIGIPTLKEDSTAYVSAVVKKHIWRLPVEVPYVPRRRRLGYAVYALLSGAYSYSLLYIVARFAGNIFRNVSPEWAFVPALGVGYLIFRSRIHTLVAFMKSVYLDKKERLAGWLTPTRKLVLAAAGVVVLFLPLWHESVHGEYVLEPLAQVPVRASVPGRVAAVYVSEGQHLPAGTPLASLRNLALESAAARTRADLEREEGRLREAQIQFAPDYATAKSRWQELREQAAILGEQAAALRLASPIAGTVMTPRPADLQGSYLEGGAELLEVADLSRLRARIYLPEFELRKATIGAEASLLNDGWFRPVRGRVQAIAPAASEIEAGLISQTKYKGIRPPRFYAVDVVVENADGGLKAGATGTAKIFGQRRSLAALAWEPVAEFLAGRIW